jgi:hypothetical protein
MANFQLMRTAYEIVPTWYQPEYETQSPRCCDDAVLQGTALQSQIYLLSKQVKGSIEQLRIPSPIWPI